MKSNIKCTNITHHNNLSLDERSALVKVKLSSKHQHDLILSVKLPTLWFLADYNPKVIAACNWD